MPLYDDALRNACTQAQIVRDEIRRWLRDENRSHLSLQQASEAIMALEEIYQARHPVLPESIRDHLHGMRTLSTEALSQALKGASDQHLGILVTQIGHEQKALLSEIAEASDPVEEAHDHNPEGFSQPMSNGNGWWRSTAVKLIGMIVVILFGWLSYHAAWTLRQGNQQIAMQAQIDTLEKNFLDTRKELKDEIIRNREVNGKQMTEVRASLDRLILFLSRRQSPNQFGE